MKWYKDHKNNVPKCMKIQMKMKIKKKIKKKTKTKTNAFEDLSEINQRVIRYSSEIHQRFIRDSS